MATIDLTTTSTLNGGSITVTIHEDTNQDGTSDNSDAISLSGGTDETNTSADVFTGGTGNDYWIEIEKSASSKTSASPTFDSASIDVPDAPDPPSDFTATRNSSNPETQIDLSWTDNSDNETGFEIEQTRDPEVSSPTWTDVTTTAADATSHTVTGLQMGERFSFRIRAVTDTDESNWVNLGDVTSGGGYGSSYGSAYGES